MKKYNIKNMLLFYPLHYGTIKTYKFVLDVKTDDFALFDGIKREIEKLDETLQLCKDVVEKRTPFTIKQEKVEINIIKSENKHITVLDTDLGTDDACALLLLKVLPKQPDYIVASYGNTTLENACKNAVLLKKCLNLDVKIVHGLPSPIKEDKKGEPFHGADGLGGCVCDMMKKLKITNDDFNEIIPFDSFKAELKKADEITFITIGTLTNFSDISDDENIKKKITGVYVMGGGINEFNCENNTEFNFSKDPESVKKLLSSGLNITLFPLDITNRHYLTIPQIDELEKIGTYPEFVKFIRYDYNSNVKFNGKNAAILHDTLPVIYYSHPEWFTLSDMRIVSDEYGCTTISPKGDAIHICTDAKENILIDMLNEVFKNTNL